MPTAIQIGRKEFTSEQDREPHLPLTDSKPQYREIKINSSQTNPEADNNGDLRASGSREGQTPSAPTVFASGQGMPTSSSAAQKIRMPTDRFSMLQHVSRMQKDRDISVAAENKRQRDIRIEELRRRMEVKTMEAEDYTYKPEGERRLRQREERLRMEQEEDRMRKVLAAEKDNQKEVEKEERKRRIQEQIRLEKERQARESEERVQKHKKELEQRRQAMLEAEERKRKEAERLEQEAREVERSVLREEIRRKEDEVRMMREDRLSDEYRQFLKTESVRLAAIAEQERKIQEWEREQELLEEESAKRKREQKAKELEELKRKKLEMKRLQEEKQSRIRHIRDQQGSGSQTNDEQQVALKQFRIEEKALKVLQQRQPGPQPTEQRPASPIRPSSPLKPPSPIKSGPPTPNHQVKMADTANERDKEAPFSETSLSGDGKGNSIQTPQLQCLDVTLQGQFQDLSKMSRPQLGVELRRLLKLKKAIKSTISDWVVAFRAREGRDPDRTDKEAISAIYRQYKDLEERIQEVARRSEQLATEELAIVEANDTGPRSKKCEEIPQAEIIQAGAACDSTLSPIPVASVPSPDPANLETAPALGLSSSAPTFKQQPPNPIAVKIEGRSENSTQAPTTQASALAPPSPKRRNAIQKESSGTPADPCNFSAEKLRDEEQRCVADKAAIKSKVKEWITNFKETHGRDPTTEDKKEIKQHFVRFHLLEEYHLKLKTRMATIEQPAGPTQQGEEIVSLERTLHCLKVAPIYTRSSHIPMDHLAVVEKIVRRVNDCQAHPEKYKDAEARDKFVKYKREVKLIIKKWMETCKTRSGKDPDLTEKKTLQPLFRLFDALDKTINLLSQKEQTAVKSESLGKQSSPERVPFEELQQALTHYQHRHNALKAEISGWCSTFEFQHKRKPTTEEKAKIRPLYIEFRAVDSKLKEIQAAISLSQSADNRLVNPGQQQGEVVSSAEPVSSTIKSETSAADKSDQASNLDTVAKEGRTGSPEDEGQRSISESVNSKTIEDDQVSGSTSVCQQQCTTVPQKDKEAPCEQTTQVVSPIEGTASTDRGLAIMVKGQGSLGKDSKDLPIPPWLRVQNVLVTSPAAQAGLQDGDSVLCLGTLSKEPGGKPFSETEVQDYLKSVENQEITVHIVRKTDGGDDSQILKLHLTPAPWAGEGLIGCSLVAVQEDGPPVEVSAPLPTGRLSVSHVVDDGVQDCPPHSPFATIDVVHPSSPAEEAGLAPGDLVIQIGSLNETTCKDSMTPIVELIRLTEGQELGIWVQRFQGWESSLLRLVIKPKKWSGKGLIGCELSLIQAQEEEYATNGVSGPEEEPMQPFAAVDSIAEGSPASDAGLFVGDYILSFGSVTASSCQENLKSILTEVKENEGREILVTLQRWMANEWITMTLPLVPHAWSGSGLLGCSITPWSPSDYEGGTEDVTYLQEASSLATYGPRSGTTSSTGQLPYPFSVIDAVSPDSPAEAAGLRAYDYLTTFGSVSHENHNDLKAVLEEVELNMNKPIKVTVQRWEEGQWKLLTLTMTPKEWGGTGYMGCVLSLWSPEAVAGAIPCTSCMNSEFATSAHAAASAGHFECLEYFTDWFDVFTMDQYGRTPLYYAAATNQLQCLALLLSFAPQWIDVGDNRGDTALHVAAANDAFEVVDFLLSSEAKVGVCNYAGMTPAHMAVSRRILELLAQHGADLITPDHAARTPLHYACERGEEDMCLYLLETAPESVHLVDENGDSPLHIAAQRGYAACVQALINMGTGMKDTQNKLGLSAFALARDIGFKHCEGLISSLASSEHSAKAGLNHSTTDPQGSEGSGRVLPPNWMEAIDGDSGKVYYYNSITGESQWEAPAPLPEG